MPLNVRSVEYRDIPERVRWFNHSGVHTHMILGVPVSEFATKQWLERVVADQNRRDVTFVDEARAETDEVPVAMGGLTGIDFQHSHAELYVVTAPEFMGKGIGTLATQWLCDYGFIALNLNRIFLHTHAENVGARRLYEGLGFAQEGVLRGHAFHLGRYVDRYVHGLLRSEWKEQDWRRTSDADLMAEFGG